MYMEVGRVVNRDGIILVNGFQLFIATMLQMVGVAKLSKMVDRFGMALNCLGSKSYICRFNKLAFRINPHGAIIPPYEEGH